MRCDGIPRCLPRRKRQKSLGFSSVNCAGEMLKGCTAGYQDLVTQHAVHSSLSLVGEIRRIWSGECQSTFFCHFCGQDSHQHTLNKETKTGIVGYLSEKKKLKFGLFGCSTRTLPGVILMDEAGSSTDGGVRLVRPENLIFRRKAALGLGCISLGSQAPPIILQRLKVLFCFYRI